MTTIYAANEIIWILTTLALFIAIFFWVRQWRKLGERIQPPVVRLMDREYIPAPKPAPTIVQMSRREPMRKRKVKKQERRRRVWDEGRDANANKQGKKSQVPQLVTQAK